MICGGLDWNAVLPAVGGIDQDARGWASVEDNRPSLLLDFANDLTTLLFSPEESTRSFSTLLDGNLPFSPDATVLLDSVRLVNALFGPEWSIDGDFVLVAGKAKALCCDDLFMKSGVHGRLTGMGEK